MTSRARTEPWPVAPLCRVCSRILHPVLMALGYRTHPTCDPNEKPAEAMT